MSTGDVNRGRTVTDQIRRRAGDFIAIIALIAVAALVGGYVLAQEGLKLPSWFPALGSHTYTIKAEFQTGQALTPGQGQAVTIAGVKVGLITGVDLQNGLALVTMQIDNSDLPIYRNATMLMRPKTQLDDMTIELDKGTPAAGALHSGETIPVSQTAPNADLDELLAALDADTRSYLQLLVGSAGPALAGRGTELSAALRRFDPTTRDFEEINRLLAKRSDDLAEVTHNLALLTSAISTRDDELANLVRASNQVFSAFARENQALSSTIDKLPGALTAANSSLGKLATTGTLAQSALGALQPTAKNLAPAERASQTLFRSTTGVLKNQIGPFTTAAQPTVSELVPTAEKLVESTPNLTSALGVLNTFFNELAYNPGPSQPGFLFYLDWLNHNLNSVLSTSDAGGPLVQSSLLFLPEAVSSLLCSSASSNPGIGLAIAPLNLPECVKTFSGGTTGASGATGG